MTTLKDFVRDTLSQIAEGVDEFESSQTGTDQNAATARPEIATDPSDASKSTAAAGFLYLGYREGYATIVDFDVAVTTEENEAKKAGGGIKVVPFRVEGGLESGVANTSVSRVSFRLPLKLT